MKTTLILAMLTAAVLAAPARAEDKATVATCGDTGCTCRLAALTPSEIEAATGIPAPEGAQDMILVSFDGAWIWSRMTGDAVDALVGGEGTCELALFDAIAPRDGTWAPSITARKATGCPAGLDSALEPALSGVAATARPVRWAGRFDPEKMSIGPSGIAWEQTGPLAYRGKVEAPGGGPATAAMTVDTRLETEDRATGRIVVQITARAGDAAGQAVLRAAGMADCRAKVDFDFTRTGD